MTKTEFLKCVSDLTETSADSLSLGMSIDSIDGFDSMVLLGVVSFADSYGIFVKLEDFEGIKSLEDIYTVLCTKK